MSPTDDTLYSQPLPKRPDTGLQAWLATIGYLSAEYSPDALLTLRIAPSERGAAWSLACAWGQQREHVEAKPDFPAALRELWAVLAANHDIHKTPEAAYKSPAHYKDHQWVDAPTSETLERLIDVTTAAFKSDWALIIVYQASEKPTMRVQARLVAHDNQIRSGGRGASIRDACRDLYRNAAPGVFASAGQPFDSFFAET
ncbi:MAG: hypothetical protein SGI73_14350 [Chloroflexota bacterium]|nr:hypothetical protein [Chloroflexota bacterium]